MARARSVPARLLDQLELTLEELESSATEDELAAEMAAAKTTKVASFTRKRPSRQPFRSVCLATGLIVPGPVACACCGGRAVQARRGHHRDAGGDSEILEGDPARPREVYLSDCEKISQVRAPFHVLPAAGRGQACWRWCCSRSLVNISR